ncbi:LOW QUALITY PROTEIN: hypothetical protein Cgig2_002102 [Carnegiea gigantea]|uniref:Uncharacterized protein n=1 Tax=Carnegiea gigantea TaxID=171969 RepID=A0A9Q1QQ35_9CARY|nr:LOW QUALITY PROTEIN: hypothetical protein Cgig2_002102 [Carnegiea gigantea]
MHSSSAPHPFLSPPTHDNPSNSKGHDKVLLFFLRYVLSYMVQEPKIFLTTLNISSQLLDLNLFFAQFEKAVVCSNASKEAVRLAYTIAYGPQIFIRLTIETLSGDNNIIELKSPLEGTKSLVERKALTKSIACLARVCRFSSVLLKIKRLRAFQPSQRTAKKSPKPSLSRRRLARSMQYARVRWVNQNHCLAISGTLSGTPEVHVCLILQHVHKCDMEKLGMRLEIAKAEGSIPVAARHANNLI